MQQPTRKRGLSASRWAIEPVAVVSTPKPIAKAKKPSASTKNGKSKADRVFQPTQAKGTTTASPSSAKEQTRSDQAENDQIVSKSANTKDLKARPLYEPPHLRQGQDVKTSGSALTVPDPEIPAEPKIEKRLSEVEEKLVQLAKDVQTKLKTPEEKLAQLSKDMQAMLKMPEAKIEEDRLSEILKKNKGLSGSRYAN